MALMGSLAACSDDDNQSPVPPPGTENVPEDILTQFNTDYPDAEGVTWTQEGDYYTASFSEGGVAGNRAWYA